MIKISLTIIAFVWFTLSAFSTLPEIGAQVFIEPGQTQEQVERWFQVLQQHNMTACRIRMFESHMRTSAGWDFSRYDHAFDMAAKYGVKVSATLFPNDGSLGGFKFPDNREHQKRIEDYIRAVVTHFKDHKALDTWVLMNEPGSGWQPWSEFAKEKYTEWKDKHPVVQHHDYLKADYSKELFWRDYTTYYLGWLAQVVRSIDTVNMTHLNNHMLFLLLREYDFPSWMPFLSNLGASIHASWHLEFFKREDYNIAIAANCDIIKDAAYPKPFWVTELQGGPNTFSGFEPLTPRPDEIAQWLWTCVGSGAERTIFWSLNARASADEAGEWALVDFQNNPTERLTKVGEITSVIKKEAALFEQAKPMKASVTLLYSPHSMITYANKVMSSGFGDKNPSRSVGADMKSLMAYYKILNRMGIPCELKQLDQFDWEKSSQHTVILANMISIPHGYAPRMEAFVKNGNKLIITGLTGMFDEYQHNVFMTTTPYKELLGAGIREWQFVRDSFNLNIGESELPVSNMRGVIYNEKAEVLATDGKDIVAVKNKLGKGEVIWVPSNIDLGAFCVNDNGLEQLVRGWIPEVIESAPVYFGGNGKHVTVRTLQSGKNYIQVFVNSSENNVNLTIKGAMSGKIPRILYNDGQGIITSKEIALSPRQTLVVVW